MKASVLTENLQKHLSIASRVVSPRVQLPILQNFLFEAKKGILVITSTDLEIGVQTQIPAKVEKEGKIAVSARSLSELVGVITEDKIFLSLDKNLLEVKTNKTRSFFPVVAHEDFPALYKELGKPVLSLEKEVFQKEFPRLVFSASTDTARPALSGILLTKEDENVVLVATDGYRLSFKQFTSFSHALKEGALEKPLLIPARVIREVIFVKDAVDKITLYVSEQSSQILFSLGDTVVVGRVIDAEFPAYKKIIPVDKATTVVFDKDEMYNAVKICSVFARDSANIIRLSFGKDNLRVSAQSPSVGQNTVDVEAQVKGEENEIAFNARYLLDVLSQLPDGDMIFEMTGPLNPGVFKIKNDPSFFHLIMPIRVQSA